MNRIPFTVPEAKKYKIKLLTSDKRLLTVLSHCKRAKRGRKARKEGRSDCGREGGEREGGRDREK